MSADPVETPLLLVRHGQTPWNVAGRWQGHADTPLTEEGLAQARAAASELARAAESEWRRIVSSDLTRARSTAEAIGEALGLAIELDARLRERDVGRWSGRTRHEIASEEPEALAAFDAKDEDVRLGGAESTRMLRARALEFVDELVRTRPGEPTIVVSHLGWIRSLVPDAPRENAARTRVVAEALLAGPSGRAAAQGEAEEAVESEAESDATVL